MVKHTKISTLPCTQATPVATRSSNDVKQYNVSNDARIKAISGKYSVSTSIPYTSLHSTSTKTVLLHDLDASFARIDIALHLLNLSLERKNFSRSCKKRCVNVLSSPSNVIFPAMLSSASSPCLCTLLRLQHADSRRNLMAVGCDARCIAFICSNEKLYRIMQT